MAADRCDRGIVGILITDRDAHLVEQVFTHLNKAIEHLSIPNSIEVIVSVRPVDTKAIASIAVNRSVLSHIVRVHSLHADYDAEWTEKFHTDVLLDAICKQRQDVVNFARDHDFDWLLFLDSDVLLGLDTLDRLLLAGESFIGAPYMPRWSAHVVVGVTWGSIERFESISQFLVNPQFYETEKEYFEVQYVGLGCALIRKEFFSVPFAVTVSSGGVKGEDIGFCNNVRAHGGKLCILSRHQVEHIAGGSSSRLFVPKLTDYPFSFLSRISVGQLAMIETGSKVTWMILTGEQIKRLESLNLDEEPADLTGKTLFDNLRKPMIMLQRL